MADGKREFRIALNIPKDLNTETTLGKISSALQTNDAMPEFQFQYGTPTKDGTTLYLIFDGPRAPIDDQLGQHHLREAVQAGLQAVELGNLLNSRARA